MKIVPLKAPAFRAYVAQFRTSVAAALAPPPEASPGDVISPPKDEVRAALAVLDRLVSDDYLPSVAEAFECVREAAERHGQSAEAWWNVLLHDCIRAEARARLHDGAIATFQRRIDAADAAEKAFKKWLEWRNKLRPGDEIYARPLRDLAAEFEFARGIARNSRKHLPRKRGTASAQTSAVGWLKESIMRLTGIPNYRHVKALAEAILGTQIDEDAIRHAVLAHERLKKHPHSQP